MTDDAPHILVVDDDERLRALLKRFLTDNGFLVTAAADAAEARGRMAGMLFDLLVLDVMMPGETGLDLCRALRRTSAVPILILTAMGEAEDRIAGLEHGADDYLAKPFEPRELLLRINSILRRVAPAQSAAEPQDLAFGAFRYDAAKEELTRDGEPLRLNAAERALLRVFAERPGTVISRDDLARRTGATANPRTVDVQITRLRKKIEPDTQAPLYLQTVRGQGYLLRTD